MNMHTANAAAYSSATALGIDTLANGEKDSEPASGVCISNAARRHTDSLGMIRLVTTPAQLPRIDARLGAVPAENANGRRVAAQLQTQRKARADGVAGYRDGQQDEHDDHDA